MNVSGMTRVRNAHGFPELVGSGFKEDTNMKKAALVFLALTLAAGLALAEDLQTAKFTAVKEMTAAKVTAAPATAPIKVGAFHLPSNPDLKYGLFCAGANATLSCEARKADGTVIARSSKLELAAGDVAILLERAGAGLASWKTVKLLVPGAILRFGGQDMGDY